MLENAPSYERLVEAFRRLPGIGKRSAERFALHLLASPESDARALSDAVRDARERIRRCDVCCDLTETQPCAVCQNTQRDRHTICVVERPSGVMAIEKGGTFRGLYHVLHGALNPLEGVGPSALTIDRLLKRLDDGITEVIVATNATAEGEATALYISRILSQRNVQVTRIAHGVPMGGGLEFADDATLTHAMQGRVKI
jgi:recombination protein RecR